LNLNEWLFSARQQLFSLGDEPISSLYALISFSLNRPAYFAQSHPDYIPTSDQKSKLDIALQRLLQGEPLAYIRGFQEFYGLDFFVNPNVLIPRPETELLVDTAIDLLSKKAGQLIAADVGTGSGCISITIATKIPNLVFLSIDKSINALKVAQENIRKHGVGNKIGLVCGDLLTCVNQQFDCICANLPYIPSATLNSLKSLRYEPMSALDGGMNGMQFIAPFLIQASQRIKNDGIILAEIEISLSQVVNELAHKLYPSAKIEILNDLAGLPRLLVINNI
jgi:release factor glutamine methyltransferase